MKVKKVGRAAQRFNVQRSNFSRVQVELPIVWRLAGSIRCPDLLCFRETRVLFWTCSSSCTNNVFKFIRRFSYILHIDTNQSCWHVSETVIAYAVLALTSLSVGYAMGARHTQLKKGGLLRDVVDKPSISEEDRDLSGEKPSMAEDYKMVRICSNRITTW